MILQVLAKQFLCQNKFATAEGLAYCLMIVQVIGGTMSRPHDTVAEPGKKQLEQIVKGNDRFDPAGFYNRPVELDVMLNEPFLVFVARQVLAEFLQFLAQNGIFSQTFDSIRHSPAFDDDSSMEKVLFGVIADDKMKSQTFDQAIKIKLTDAQATLGSGINNTQKVQRPGGLPDNISADAELLSHFPFGRQPIPRFKRTIHHKGFYFAYNFFAAVFMFYEINGHIILLSSLSLVFSRLKTRLNVHPIHIIIGQVPFAFIVFYAYTINTTTLTLFCSTIIAQPKSAFQ
jgi:hypothetical protein